MTTAIIAIIVLSIAVIALLLALLLRRPQDYTQSLTLLQQRVGQIEEQVKRSVDEGSKAIGEKFESSLKVIGDIKEKLGGLAETNKQMLDIGKDIASLQDLLKPPKPRGDFGEAMLHNILAQMLPPQSYEMQYSFKDGSRVDAAVRVGAKWVPIDSKFPLESFQRYLECSEEGEKKSHLKEFERSIKAKIDDISSKYILVDEGTYDFALMYIPSENVYYQTILKGDLQIDGRGISDYAAEKRVVIVSPNSIYAYLQVICLGLRGMQFESNIRRIMDDFARLNKELENFEGEFNKLGSHLEHAYNTFGRADKQLAKFSSKLPQIGEPPEIKEIEEPEEITQ